MNLLDTGKIRLTHPDLWKFAGLSLNLIPG